MADTDIPEVELSGVEDSSGKAVDARVSVTVHLQPDEALRVDAAAARARMTRHDLVRNLLLGRAHDDTPLLACLAKMIAIHHRLERTSILDDDLRADIVMAVRELTAATRAEVAG